MTKCIELVPHFQKGAEPKLLQCKRSRIEGSDRCRLHSKSFIKNGNGGGSLGGITHYNNEQSSIR